MDNSGSFSYSTPSVKKTRRLPKLFGRSSFKPKNLLKVILPVALIGAALISIVSLINSNKNSGTLGASSDSKEQVELAAPKEKITLNKQFEFPLLDETGKEVGKFTYTLETAELNSEIIVKGSRATAVKGREFLIINLKIVNSLDKGVEINSRDFIRLIVNGNTKELLAPDIHNDPVEVQAISTKYSRVGFAINESDNSLVLQVGQINGDKQTVPLNFKK